MQVAGRAVAPSESKTLPVPVEVLPQGRVFTLSLCPGFQSLSCFDGVAPTVLDRRTGSEDFVDVDKAVDIFFLGTVVGACFAVAALRWLRDSLDKDKRTGGSANSQQNLK